MRPRRHSSTGHAREASRFWWAACAAAATAALAAPPWSFGAATASAAEATSQRQRLFVIERSKNANVVQYDLRTTPRGHYEVRSPLDVYWVMKADKGQREELSMVERQLAYGYKLRPGATARELTLELVAVPSRPIRVRKGRDTYVAETTIAGKPAVLERIFVTSKDAFPLPKVVSIDLFGRDAATGAAVQERLSEK